MRPQPARTAPCSQSETTPAPHPDLVRRQTQANLIGYTYNGLAWDSFTCNSGAVFSESKPFGSTLPGYAGCVYTTGIANDLPTSCAASTLLYKATSFPCKAGYKCVTGIVAPTKGSEIDGDLYFECDTVADWIVYRTTPVDIVTTSPSSASGPATVNKITSPAAASTSTQISSGPASITGPTSSSLTSQTSTPNKGFSGAAIAGAVVGPICGVALILGLVFMLLRRRRNKAVPPVDPLQPPTQQYLPQTQQYPPPNQQYQQYPPSAGYPAQISGYGDGKEIVQVNTNAVDANRPMSIPPAYVAPGSPNSPMGNTAMGTMPPPQQQQQQQQTWMNNPSPPPPGVQPPPMQMQGGRPATAPLAELGTNPQVSGMPSELPDSNRQGH